MNDNLPDSIPDSPLLGKDQFDALSRMIADLQTVVNDTNAGLANDRSNIDKLLIRTGSLEEAQQLINKRFEEFEKKVKNWVKDAVGKEIEQTVPILVETVLKEYIESKQPKPKKPQKSFWKRLFKREE